MKEFIEIPFGAKDSELGGWEYNIPEGMEATIVDNKIVVRQKESEDEKIRKGIIKYLEQSQFGEEHYCIDDDIVRNYISWLEKQGEKGTNGNEREIPNSVWSEEDEKAVNDIMWIIEAYRKNGFNETHIQIANNSENWLKSLKDKVQPNQWKPSDEQLNALDEVYKIHGANSACRKIIFNLLEQLKKL